MFETARLIMRPIEDLDFKTLKRGMNSVDYLSTAAHIPLIPLLDEEIKDILMPKKPGHLPHFAICKKPESTESSTDIASLPVIGTIGLHNHGFDFKNRVCELGVGFFGRDDRGKGYGREAVGWLIQYAFDELNMHKLQLSCFSNNLGGIALYKKLGFVQEGHLRKTKWMTGQWYDTLLFGMLEEEYLALPKTTAA